MNKKKAIKYVQNYGAIELIKKLIIDGDTASAISIIEDCWCAEDETVIEDIKETWNEKEEEK